MKKNLYYRTVFRRRNILSDYIFNFFLSLCSYPRLFLEVFIRKNFGERYFSFGSVCSIGVVMIGYPIVRYGMAGGFSKYGGYGEGNAGFWGDYVTWYIYVGFFLYFGFKRWTEVKRNPSVFDFERFSLYTGDVNPKFYEQRFGYSPNPRVIEILLEPLIFLIPGLLLWWLGQYLGIVLVVCSIFYGLGYAGAYKKGDDFIMDKIDELILNEEMEDAFIGDQTADKTKGVRFYARKPTGEELRRKVAVSFIEDDDEDDFTEAK